MSLPSHPFDDDKLREECGVFGVIGVQDAASFVALGLHALQHRGQEAAGIVAHSSTDGFTSARRFGYVRDSFTSASLMETLPGPLSIGHVRYSTAGSKGNTQIRDVQPLFAELAMGGCAVAHNGNLVNALSLREELIQHGSIFQSGSDTECIIHLMARSIQKTIPERLKDALRRVEGAFSIVAMTRSKLIGVRDPLGVRPLMLGRVGDGWVLSSETCALDIIGAEFVREVEPGEMVIATTDGGIDSFFPFQRVKPRFCVFENVYFSRPDSVIGGHSVYETRRRIGVELAREAPVEADLVCPIPDSGTPAAIGYSQESGIPYAMGIIRNQYMGRTFIEPSEQIRNMGVRLKLNVNRAVIAGKRVVLVDDSVVRGTTSPEDPRDGDRGRRRGGAFPHRLAADAMALLLRRRYPRPRQAARRHHDRGGDAAVCRRRQPEVRLARRPLPRLRRGWRPQHARPAILRRLLLRRLSGPARPTASSAASSSRSTRDRHPDPDPGSPAPTGPVTLVTGASRGLGYALARALGARGHQVVAMARTVGGLEDLADEIEASGGPTPTLVPLSMTDEPGMQRLCLAIHERWGRLDLALHCAAHAPPLAPAAHIADKDFDQAFEVNVKGTERLIVYLAPLLGPGRPFRLPGRHPRRTAVLRQLRRLKGRCRGPRPLLRRRVGEDRPPGHAAPPQPDAHRAPRPLLPRRGHVPAHPLRRRSRTADRDALRKPLRRTCPDFRVFSGRVGLYPRSW